MAETAIEWTDVVWNPTRGCSRVSPGCGGGTPGARKGGCYAERMAIRLSGPGQAYEGLVKSTPAGPRWTGKVVLDAEKLLEPLHWRKPRRVFVNSMSDLFHEELQVKDIARVFAVMALARRHTFQVLTKRADVMARTVGSEDFRGQVLSIAAMEATRRGLKLEPGDPRWPLPNVWLGVSVEDQQRADERIPELLRTPAAVRWLSCEPLLGAVDLARFIQWRMQASGWNGPVHHHVLPAVGGSRGLDWVVVGGESGPGARPMHPVWARRLRDQCVGADVRFFFKQWGAWKPCCVMTEPEVDALYEPVPEGMPADSTRRCRVPEVTFPTEPLPVGGECHTLFAVGKTAAGRVLDGRTWDEMPEVVRG
ncbi:phage Gp37/Gp68 family protein [Corallococcus exiguus]|nr:phage Gp37/Gp68 family protein [Corallococcus exiguus]